MMTEQDLRELEAVLKVLRECAAIMEALQHNHVGYNVTWEVFSAARDAARRILAKAGGGA